MSKIFSLVIIALLVIYIAKGVKSIIETFKAKKAEKNEQSETECDTTESKEE